MLARRAVALAGSTSFGQLYVEPTVNLSMGSGAYDIGWLVAQQDLTFAQPTKLGRISPAAGKTVWLQNNDLRGSDIVVDDVGQVKITGVANLSSLQVSPGASLEAATSFTVRPTSSLSPMSQFDGGLSGSGALTFHQAQIGFGGHLRNTGTSAMTFNTSQVQFATPAAGYAVTGNFIADASNITVEGTGTTSPNSNVTLKNSYWSGGSELTMKSLSVDGGAFSVPLFNPSVAGLTVTNGVTVISGAFFGAENASIAGGLLVDGQSTAFLTGQVDGTATFKGQTLLYNVAARSNLRFTGATTFETGTTIQMPVLLDPDAPAFFDFDGPTLIGTPHSYFYLLLGMDGKLTVDVSSSGLAIADGAYRLMDFSNGGFRMLSAINTIYPTLDNFNLVQANGLNGQLVMDGNVLEYVVGVPEPSMLVLALCFVALMRTRRSRRRAERIRQMSRWQAFVMV